MHIFKMYILPILLFVLLVWGVRMYVVCPFSIGHSDHSLRVWENRILVLRYPLFEVRKGADVVYRDPRTGQYALDELLALPGDSVYIMKAGKGVRHRPQEGEYVGVLVPGKHEPIEKTTCDTAFYCYVLGEYEHCPSSLPSRIYFSEDYYWLKNYGIIHRKALVGERWKW